MMVFCWHVTGWIAKPYPVLWYFDPGHKGDAQPQTLTMIRQRHYLTEEEQEETAALRPEDRVNYLAKKFPYKEPVDVDNGVASVSLFDAIDAAADRKRVDFEASDGQRKFIRETS